MVAVAFGYGNVLRFPFYCYKHGGGTFLVVYFACFMVIGVPLLVLQLTISQFTSASLYHNMDLVPALKGIGISCWLITLLDITTYDVGVSNLIYYFFASFQAELPWTTCGKWSSQLCETKLTKVNNSTCLMDPTLVLYPNGTCYNRTTNVLFGISDMAVAKSFKIVPHLPAEDYLNAILPQKESDKDFTTGALRWDLALCLLAAWLVQYFLLLSGVANSKRFVKYVTIITYTLLVILFIFGIMQEGSDDGIRLYMRVNVTKLTEPQIWKDGAVQVIYSVGALEGAWHLIGSKNQFYVNLIRDGIVVCFIDALTSWYAGFVVFHFIGGFAKVRNVDIASLISEASDILYIIIPQACTVFPHSSLLSVLFFAMLALLGMKCIYQYIIANVVFISDTSSFLKKNKFHITTFICYLSFMIGLLGTVDGGKKVIDTIINLAFNWNLFVLAGLFCVSVMIYGPFRISKDIEIMLDDAKSCTFILPWKYLKWYFISCWCFILPSSMAVLAISKIMEEVQSRNSEKAQIFMTILGPTMTLISIPIVFMKNFIETKGTFKERIKTIFSPSIKWGPYLVEHRLLVTYVEDFDVNPRNL